jgi:arabinose-5-phosphate isomerase
MMDQAAHQELTIDNCQFLTIVDRYSPYGTKEDAMTDQEMLDLGRAVIRAEGDAIMAVAAQVGPSFVVAVQLVSGCTGAIMATGSGTSGTIARRLAHLLATCGMHAFFVHPADALHGPSAAVAPGDVLIALSKAGKSAEINDFARVTRARGGKVISLTWKPDSELGALSDVVLALPNTVAAEGEGVLPFGSTLAAGALCDALCLAAKKLRGFDLATLAQTHPSGATAELVRK